MIRVRSLRLLLPLIFLEGIRAAKNMGSMDLTLFLLGDHY